MGEDSAGGLWILGAGVQFWDPEKRLWQAAKLSCGTYSEQLGS